MVVVKSIFNSRIKLQSIFAASNNLRINDESSGMRYAFSDHIYMREAPNVAFRISVATQPDTRVGTQCSAHLFMVDPTPKGSKCTITWNVKIARQENQVLDEHVGKMRCIIYLIVFVYLSRIKYRSRITFSFKKSLYFNKSSSFSGQERRYV